MLIVGLYLVSSVFGAIPASEHHNITNESVTQNVGNWVKLKNASIARKTYGNETVYNSSGTKLTAGTDYKFATSNTSIEFLSSGSTNNGSAANVSYSFDARPASARNSIGTIGQAFTLGAVAVIVLVAALILSLIGSGMSGGGGRYR